MPSLDSVIRVQTEIAEAAADATARFGGALIVTTDADVLAASGEHKIGHYANLASVATDGFASITQPYRAAAAYFGQSPAPSRLSIARWAKQAVNSEIVGSSSHDDLTTITGSVTRLVSGDAGDSNVNITSSTNTLIGIGGVTTSVTLVEGNGRTPEEVRADLETKLRAGAFTGADGIRVTLEGSPARFVITVPAGVSIRARGLDGTANAVLGFDAASNPDYEAPFTMSVGGGSATVNVLLSNNGGVPLGSLSGTASVRGVAYNLQLALRQAADPAGNQLTAFDNLAVAYDSLNSRFEIRDTTASTLGVPEDTPLAQAMGLSVSSGAESHTGSSVAETAADFLASVSTLNDDWYWVVLDSDIYGEDDDAEAFSEAMESTSKQLILDVVSPAPPSDNAVAARDRNRTSIIWSATADYKAAALAGQFAARDLNRPGTALTAKFRSLTGRATDSLAPAQITSLNTQGINYYTEFGGAAILAEGVATAEARFIETQQWIDWFTHEVQTGIYDLLRSSNRVPQTAAGIAELEQSVLEVCLLGISNGGIAPGVVSANVAAAIRTEARLPDFDGELHNGYLVHIDPVTRLTEAQRTAGNVPPIRVWLKGSGAVHFVDLDLTFGG